METTTKTKETIKLVPMPVNEIHSRIGSMVHLNWAKPHAKWVLRGYYTDQYNKLKAKLETPKTKKTLEVSVGCLMVIPGIYEKAVEAISQQQELPLQATNA